MCCEFVRVIIDEVLWYNDSRYDHFTSLPKNNYMRKK